MIEYVPLIKHKVVTNNYKELNMEQKFKDAISIILHELFICEHFSIINQIYLFGSCAKQETKLNSDVDILIVLQTDVDVQYYKEYFRNILYYLTMTQAIQVEYDIIVYTQEQFDFGKMPLTLAIKQSNLLLYSKGGISDE